MTDDQRIALYGIKGMLQAHISIHAIIVKIASHDPSEHRSDYMQGFDAAQIAIASKAVKQNQRVLGEINALLEGAKDEW